MNQEEMMRRTTWAAVRPPDPKPKPERRVLASESTSPDMHDSFTFEGKSLVDATAKMRHKQP